MLSVTIIVGNLQWGSVIQDYFIHPVISCNNLDPQCVTTFMIFLCQVQVSLECNCFHVIKVCGIMPLVKSYNNVVLYNELYLDAFCPNLCSRITWRFVSTLTFNMHNYADHCAMIQSPLSNKSFHKI